MSALFKKEKGERHSCAMRAEDCFQNACAAVLSNRAKPLCPPDTFRERGGQHSQVTQTSAVLYRVPVHYGPAPGIISQEPVKEAAFKKASFTSQTNVCHRYHLNNNKLKKWKQE